jgi:two-component system CheB/CheR fusion protein
MLERIFDLFVQGEQSLDRSAGGMGVGLSMVKAILELHGGEVRAVSEGVGKGAEFVARMPLTIQLPTIAEPRAPSRSGLPTIRPRVVVIEDEADNRETLHLLLAEEGFEVVAARTGQEGLDAAERIRPGLVVVDLGLPGVDGFEIARQLRVQFGRQIRLVALTGYGQSGDRAESRDAGFDEHLVKPLRVGQLAALFERLTGFETGSPDDGQPGIGATLGKTEANSPAGQQT